MIIYVQDVFRHVKKFRVLSDLRILRVYARIKDIICALQVWNIE